MNECDCKSNVYRTNETVNKKSKPKPLETCVGKYEYYELPVHVFAHTNTHTHTHTHTHALAHTQTIDDPFGRHRFRFPHTKLQVWCLNLATRILIQYHICITQYCDSVASGVCVCMCVCTQHRAYIYAYIYTVRGSPLYGTRSKSRSAHPPTPIPVI